MRALANWLYGIQILSLNMNENSRFMVYQDGNFKTSCLAVNKCRSGESTDELASNLTQE